MVLEKDCGLPITSDRFMRRKYSTLQKGGFISQKGGFISQIVRKVRYVTYLHLSQIEISLYCYSS